MERFRRTIISDILLTGIFNGEPHTACILRHVGAQVKYLIYGTYKANHEPTHNN